MALRKNTESTAPAAGTFEAPEGADTAVVERVDEATVVAETPAASTAAPAADEATPVTEVPSTPEARAAANRALLAASTRAMASPLKSVQTVIEGLRNVIEGADLESMGIGVFPRVTVGLDGFSIDKTKDLGKKIKIEILSWNYVWLVTTGEQNDTEANKLIRTSYDGINLKGGEGTVTDYVAHLKAEDYDKASCKQYVEIYANLLWSEEKGDVPVEEQTIHQISLSPQSVGKWGAYNLESKMRKLKGFADTNIVVMEAEKKVLGPNKFGVVKFSAK